MTKHLLVLLLVSVLVGCAQIQTPLDEGYKFGDTTDSVLYLRAEYCAETNPARRAYRVAFLRAVGAEIPVSGICFNIVSEAAKRGLLPDIEVDVDQANKDQERFQ